MNFPPFSLFYRGSRARKKWFWIMASEAKRVSRIKFQLFSFAASEFIWGHTMRMREDPESKPRSCFQVLSGGFLGSRYADYGIVNVNYSRNVSGGTTTEGKLRIPRHKIGTFLFASGISCLITWLAALGWVFERNGFSEVKQFISLQSF